VEKRPVKDTNAMALWSPLPKTFAKSSEQVHDAIEVLRRGVIPAPTPPVHSVHRMCTKLIRVLALVPEKLVNLKPKPIVYIGNGNMTMHFPGPDPLSQTIALPSLIGKILFSIASLKVIVNAFT